MTSIQNILDLKRVEGITISRETRSKMPPTGLGAHCGPPPNKTVRQSPTDDAPPVQLRAPFLHAPSADASGRAIRRVRAPHPTDGDQDGQIFRSCGASRQRTAIHKAFIGALKQVKTANSAQTETSYDDLRRACLRSDPGCVSILYAMFPRTP